MISEWSTNGDLPAGVHFAARTEIEARLAFNPRRRRLLAGFHALLDGRGTYADVSATLRYVDFGDEALFPLRTELRIFNRAAIGTPLGGSGLNIEAAITHSYRNYSSSSLLADYSSIGQADFGAII